VDKVNQLKIYKNITISGRIGSGTSQLLLKKLSEVLGLGM